MRSRPHPELVEAAEEGWGRTGSATPGEKPLVSGSWRRWVVLGALRGGGLAPEAPFADLRCLHRAACFRSIDITLPQNPRLGNQFSDFLNLSPHNASAFPKPTREATRATEPLLRLASTRSGSWAAAVRGFANGRLFGYGRNGAGFAMQTIHVIMLCPRAARVWEFAKASP